MVDSTQPKDLTVFYVGAALLLAAVVVGFFPLSVETLSSPVNCGTAVDPSRSFDAGYCYPMVDYVRLAGVVMAVGSVLVMAAGVLRGSRARTHLPKPSADRP